MKKKAGFSFTLNTNPYTERLITRYSKMSTTNAIYEYLKTQNRPYNANDIVTNLKQEFPKTAVQKSLDKLVDSKKVLEKVYGKQKIYCVIQDRKQEPEELTRIQNELDRHVVEVIGKRVELEQQLRSKQAELTALKTSLTVDDAKVERNRLLAAVETLQKKIDTLTKASGSEDLNESKKRATKNAEIYNREYSKRKRLCGEVIESIMEGYPGNKKNLYEEIGIEIVNL